MAAIGWHPAPPDPALRDQDPRDQDLRDDQERWPLLDDLLPPQSPTAIGTDRAAAQARAALRALIDAAFGP